MKGRHSTIKIKKDKSSANFSNSNLVGKIHRGKNLSEFLTISSRIMESGILKALFAEPATVAAPTG
jgi:hypothetical protein